MNGIIGKRIDKLVVIKRLKGSRLICECDCGNNREVSVGHFNTGKVKSCGCHIVRHGHGGSKTRSRTYISYHNMIARCHKETNKRYKDYGAKGIEVCERWRMSFVDFLNDMGECPDSFTIDRIDNDRGYSPDNCRWVSREENQANRSNSQIWIVKGERFSSLREASEYLGAGYQTIRAWCKGRKSEGRYYPSKDNCWVENRYGD